jgi:spore coat protein JB
MPCKLKQQIHAYDFAILEIGLFLDTHPCDTAALQKRQELQAQRQMLVEEYERQYGAYVVVDTDVCGDAWTWVQGPWPWENERGNGYVAV